MKIFRLVWPVLILAILCFMYFADTFIAGEIFSFRDLSRYYYPLRLFAVNLIESGSFPFWNPYIASGHPLFATLQSAVLYPLSIIYYLGNFATTFNLFIVLHIFLGGLFFYLLMRELKFDQTSSLISAIVFSFSGYLIAAINLITTLAAVIWFPLVFLFYKKLIEQGKFIYLILTSIFLGFMFLGGEPTPLYATIFLLGLYTLMIRPRALVLYVACILIFILLFSFQILPLWELIGLSGRAGLSFEKVTFWSFHPRNVVNFFLPFFYGPPILRSHDGPSPLTQDWLLLSYLGVLPAILFLISIIFRKDKTTAFFKISFILGLILIFGKFTPIYRILCSCMPGFSFLRFPVKFFFINAVSFAYLCGAGFNEYWRMVKERNEKFLKFMSALFAVSFVMAILFLLLDIYKEDILSLGVTYAKHLESVYGGNPLAFYITIVTNFFNFRRMLVFFILGVFLMFIGARKGLKQAVFSSLILVLIFVDYYGLKNIKVNTLVPKEIVHSVTSNLKVLKEDRELFRVYATREQNKANEVMRGRSYEEALPKSIDSLCANRTMVQGIYTVRGYLSIHNANHDKIIMMLDMAPLPSTTNVLNMLNVKYIVSPESIDDPTCKLVNKGHSYLYRNKNVLPRAYLVPRYVILKTEDEIAYKMRSKAWRPDEEVILEEIPVLSRQSSVVSRQKEQADIIKYEPNEVVIEASVKKKAKFLVLADNYYPGWEVEVDGEKDKIYKANFILRGVYLAPGKHTVRFYYNPISFKIGVSISLISALILSFIGLFLKKRNTQYAIGNKHDFQHDISPELPK